jgi:hypothetical protein
MNGNPVNQCASPDCAIYQYRTGTSDTALKVAFLPLKTPIVQGIKESESKDVNSYGKTGKGLKTHYYGGLRGSHRREVWTV